MKYTPKQRLLRLYWFFANPLRRAFRFTFRHKIFAVKCLVEHDGEFLIVRINYAHRRWSIPGGAVDRNETFEDAAKRELFEEVRICADVLHKIGEYTIVYEKCPLVCHVYYHRAKSKKFKVDGLEIAEAQWFRPEQLPSPHQPSVENVLTMYRIFVSTPTRA